MPELTGLGGLKLDAGMLAKSLDPTVLAERMGLPTIATTGVQESTLIAKFAGVLTAVQFVAKDALAASDTNFVLFTVVNRGAGGGSTAMLAVSAANGTQVTGGAAIAPYVKRSLTLNATPANLVVNAGDTISVISTVTGTLANAVTAPSFLLTITPS
jgi:hypothetical protein